MGRFCSLIALLFLAACSAKPVGSVIPSGLANYGNWCGLDHPRDMQTAAAPIDALDASCMQHDYCYAEKGQFACECDQTLTRELSSKLKTGELNGTQAAYARSAYHYFKGSPCTGVADGKAGPTKLLNKLYSNGKAKAASLYEKVLGESAEPEPEDNTEPSSPLTSR